MIRLPYTQPFGKENQQVPILNASSYQLFIVQSRLFPEIYQRFPYSEPSFMSYPDGNQMRLFIELKEYDFPVAITDRQLSELQIVTDEIFQNYPNHCLLNYRSDIPCQMKSCRRQLDNLVQDYPIDIYSQINFIEDIYHPVVYKNQLLVDLSQTGNNYPIIYDELVNRIFQVSTERIQLLSSLIGPTGNTTANSLPIESIPYTTQLNQSPYSQRYQEEIE